MSSMETAEEFEAKCSACNLEYKADKFIVEEI